jgi:hypothetical protein
MATLMKRILATAVIFAALATPALAQTTPAPVSPFQTAGIWRETQWTSFSCGIMGESGGYVLGFTASLKTLSSFTLDIVGAFPRDTAPSATLSYGGGLTQTLIGTLTAQKELEVTLDNSATNNFATFLHGFTAGTTMSV